MGCPRISLTPVKGMDILLKSTCQYIKGKLKKTITPLQKDHEPLQQEHDPLSEESIHITGSITRHPH